MPGQTSRQKDLYLGKCLDDLHKLSEVKPLTASCNVIIKSADKVFKEAESYFCLGDEEKAFVMYMKYFNILTQVKAKADYKKQKVYHDKMIGPKNQVTAIDRAESLSVNLKERYDLREAEAVAKKLSQLSPTSEAKKDPEIKILKEKKKKEEKKEDEKNSKPATPGSITCQNLIQLLRDPGIEVILMDVRSGSDYNQSHISHTSCISVPEEVVKPGSTVSRIQPGLPPNSVELWERRRHADHIVMLDWNSGIESLAVGTTLNTLKDALYKFDTHTVIKSEPIVLEGGYSQWLLYYPTMTTNAHVARPKTDRDREPSPTATLDFDYPDLDGNLQKVGALTVDNNLPDTPANQQPPVTPDPALTPAPRFDRALKPNALGGSFINNGSFTSPPHSEDFHEGSVVIGSNGSSTVGGNLYPVSSIEKSSERKIGDKNVNILNEVSNNKVSKSLSLDVDLKESEMERGKKEEELKEFRSRMEMTLKDDNTKVKEAEKKLFNLEELRRKEQRDVADLMRMKKKVTEEIEAERKKLEEDRKRLAEEEEDRKRALSVAQEVEEENRRRMAEVEKLREERKAQEEEETRRQAAEDEAEIKRDLDRQMKRMEEEKEKKRAREELERAEEEKRKELERLEIERMRREKERKEKEELERKRRLEEEEERLIAEKLKVERQEEMRKEEERKRKDEERKRKEEEERVKQSGMSTSKRVPSNILPEGWEKRIDKATNRYFYIDHKNGKTQWSPPEHASSPGLTTVRLKDEPSVSSSRGLSRSHSSPNIMKELAEEERKSQKQPQPGVDRSIKPVISKPQFVYQKRAPDFNPVYGNVGAALTGLRNLGNTCYMNSTVQCLNNTSPLVSYFLNDYHLQDINRESSQGMHGEVVDDFAAVVKALWSQQYRSITPRDLKNTVGKYNPMFAGYQQQDSQEFLTFLLDGLHEGMNEVRKSPQIPEQNNDKMSDLEAGELAWKHHRMLHRSVIVELFQGQLKSTLTCLACNKKSTTFQAFMFLSLPIPASSRCSLKDCMREFLRPEMMTGSSRWKCPRCRVERDAEKKIDIWRVPRILLIGLNRFYSQGMWMEKKGTYVDFPINDLDLSESVLGQKPRKPYNLYGVSNHYGTMEGGHYTASCRNPVTKRWNKFDDADVREISSSDVKTSAAFVLYYSSIDLHEPQYRLAK